MADQVLDSLVLSVGEILAFTLPRTTSDHAVPLPFGSRRCQAVRDEILVQLASDIGVRAGFGLFHGVGIDLGSNCLAVEFRNSFLKLGT